MDTIEFHCETVRFIVGTQSWKRLNIIRCENENAKCSADYIEIRVFLMH